jgi:hypothetical protein
VSDSWCFVVTSEAGPLALCNSEGLAYNRFSADAAFSPSCELSLETSLIISLFRGTHLITMLVGYSLRDL